MNDISELLQDQTSNGGYGVIGMQEVNKETIRSRGIDVSAYMAQKIFPSYSHSHFAANVSFRKGEYGNAVVTNIGVIKTQEVKFTKTRREQRGAVATKLSFGNGKFLLWLALLYSNAA